jgi:DNA-binding response OmpR family regulator
MVDVYDDGFLRVEHENYYVSCGGTNVKLPRSEFLILSRLVRTPERFVSAHDLWEQAWSNRKQFNSVSLHVYMYRLRRKFEPFRIQFETMVNVGYRLIPAATKTFLPE